MKRFSLTAAVSALILSLSPGAFAAGEDGTPPQGTSREDSLGDGELTNFVAAFVRLIGVQHGYMVMMQEEGDPDRLADMKRDALTDMTDAVERDGMSVDRYNQIALAVRDDPELQDRVEAILQQLASDPSARPAPQGD